MITGCASATLSPQGRMVREIQPDWKNKCKFLGSDSVNSAGFVSMGKASDFRKTTIAMKNKVAAQGGNAYVMNLGYPGLVAVIDFEIYKCPEN